MTLHDLRDLENEVKVTGFYLGLRLSLVPLCTQFSETSSNSFSDIKRKTFQITLNNLRNLENKVKVTRFEIDLSLVLVLLCTEFNEDISNSSSDIERKPSFTRCRLE